MAEASIFAEALRRNAQAFDKLLPRLAEGDEGKCALLREGELVQLFDTTSAALEFAEERYPDGLYMLRQVTKAA